MIVRGLDQNGDWLFGKSQNDYRVDKEALKQNIKTRLSSFLGDCFFALDSGIDWFNLLGSKNQTALSLSVSSTILNTEGILKINSLLINVNLDRNIAFMYDVDTNYGQITATLAASPSGQVISTEFGEALTTEDGEILITE